MNFKDRDEKHITEKNLAWEDYLIDCAHAGYNVKNSVTNRSLFMNGYHAGSEKAESLEAQLAQAEDIANTSSNDLATANATILDLEGKLAAAERLANGIETYCKAMFRGGYRDEAEYAIFVHGMETVCRVIRRQLIQTLPLVQKENTDEIKSPFHDVFPVNIKAEFVGRIDPKPE
jgi:hypothetical protein